VATHQGELTARRLVITFVPLDVSGQTDEILFSLRNYIDEEIPVALNRGVVGTTNPVMLCW
jgi:hypothetical protein